MSDATPLLPHDPAAEATLIGSMLVDRSCVPIVREIVTGGDFFDPRHAAIFDAIATVYDRTTEGNTISVDVVLVHRELSDRQLLRPDDHEYIIEVMESANPPSAGYHAEIVRQMARRRRLAVVLDRATRRMMEPGGEPDDILAELDAEATELRATVGERFTFSTAAEFDSLDLKRDYHVPGILAAGPVPTIMAGSFKTLKTSIVMDLAFSLATHSKFLGHFPTATPTRVTVMSGESGGFALQSLIRRIAQARGWSLARVGDNFRICTGIPSLDSADDLRRVERYITEHEIKLFILDPVYLAMRGLGSDDAGSLFAMGRFLEPLARIGERTGCTPLIVHHNSRGATRANAGEPAELADIAWSGFAEWAGQWLLLSRRERYNPDSDGEHRLWLTAGGRDGHSTLVGVNVTEGRHDDPMGRRWDVQVEQAAHARRDAVVAEQERREQERETRRQKQAEQDRDAVMQAMQSAPEGDTKTGIRDRSGLRNERFNPIFADLLRDGVATTCTITKGNSRQYEGFTLQQFAPGRNGTHNGQKHRPAAIASETDAPL